MLPSQGRDRGSIPLTRSRVKLAYRFDEWQVGLAIYLYLFKETYDVSIPEAIARRVQARVFRFLELAWENIDR